MTTSEAAVSWYGLRLDLENRIAACEAGIAKSREMVGDERFSEVRREMEIEQNAYRSVLRLMKAFERDQR